jgi:uncharacterized membrane protein (DUF2068 family)
MPSHAGGPRALTLIALFKFFKAALLVVLAFALLHLRHPQVSEHFVSWLRAFPFATGHQLISDLIETILGTTERAIGVFGGIALGYAVLYAIEGFGLWRNAHWAEYLTVISTCLLIPIEIWEILRHPTALKWLTLVINLSIVVYLVHLLRAERQGGANDQSPAGSPSA